MKNLAMIQRALTAPWAVPPQYLPMLAANLRRMIEDGGVGEPTEVERPELDDLVVGQIAVMPMRGLLLQRPGQCDCWGMATYTDWWGDAFEEMVSDSSVAGVVIDQDSPGGIIYGTPELSDRIYAARGKKPIFGISNALSASASYWIGTATDRLYITASGELGSVGVRIMHTDMSKMLEEWGVDITLIHAGEFKVEGNPFEPLSEEGRAELQRAVDEGHEMFIAAVARNLGVDAKRVRSDFGRGRTVTAQRAVELGMAYGVATLADVIGECARVAGVPPVQALEGRGMKGSADVEVRTLDGPLFYGIRGVAARW